MGMGTTDRWRWLGQPFFLGAVGLLALNDHVLKQRWPSWWTGKLSDVAGVIVAGTAASVILGRRRGLVAAGVAFAALKTVPGAPRFAAPLLGGPTLQDPTDLLALLALLPLAKLLGRLEARPADRPPIHADLRRSIRAALAVALPVLASFATIVTATATACGGRPMITEIDVRGTTFFAEIVTGSWQHKWARSTDGGLTWTKSAPPPDRATRAGDTGAFFDGPPNGPLQSCTPDGACLRVSGQERIEQRAPDGTWTVERQLTDAERTDSYGGCAGGRRGTLGSIGTAGSGSDLHAVASLGADGVLVRTDQGTWVRRPVLSVRPMTNDGVPRRVLVPGLLVMGLTGLGLIVYGRRRWAFLVEGVAVYLGGTIASVSVLGTVGLLLNADEHELGISPIAVASWLVIWTVTVALTIKVARRPKRPLPLWMLPPPPSTSPG